MRKRRCIKGIFAILLLLLFLQPGYRTNAATTDEIQSQIDALEKRREELQGQIDELNAKMNENAADIREMVDNKNSIDQQIELLHQQEAILLDEICELSVQIADTQDRLDAAQLNYDSLKERYKERIRTMEEQPAPSYWSVLFEADSFVEYLDHVAMLNEIAQADQNRLQQLKDAKQLVEDTQCELLAQKDAYNAKQTQQIGLLQELESKRETADAILRELVKQGEEFDKLLEASEQTQEDLMQQLAQQENAYKDAQYQEWLQTQKPSQQLGDSEKPEQSEGATWITPLSYYTLSSAFGNRFHPILNTWRMHNGVDMAAATGTEIYAARSGVVITAAYQADGAGNYVQIDHGDGYRSIYMHMTRYIVSPGQYVQAGQVIGYVGNSGLSKGSHLHFGISYQGTYINPMEYIH